MIDSWFLLPAIAVVVGLLALLPLGVQVLQRGVVFIDLAVAQAAAAFATWAGLWFHAESMLELYGASISGAILCVTLINMISRRWPAYREALIGLLYVASACLALLGARMHPHGNEQLLNLLAADVLWVMPEQVIIMSIMAITVIALQYIKPSWGQKDLWFYAVFAIIISWSVSALGLFLVFTGLIAPALWVLRGYSWPYAAIGSILFASFGLVLSWLADLPSGIIIALCMTVMGLLSVVTSQRQ